jgi:Na+-translocating ferredoxin:NAD+ oxidoreductase subunit B
MSAKEPQIPEKDRVIYENFITWLKQSWYGVPDSDVLLPYVATRYTPKEAAFLTGMPFAPKTLAELSDLTKTSTDMLGPKLDALASKGLVYKHVKDGSARYYLNDIFFIYRSFGWPGHHDEYDRTVGPLQHKYIAGGLMSPWQNVKEKGLRVLPVDATIKDSRGVLPYEEVRKILDKVDYFTVSHCPCRHTNNLDPDSPDCQYPTEVCLHFDKLGRYIVENGMGREITRQETEEILKRSAELGLIHGISNQQEKPDTICNCCRDCCIWFIAMKRYGHSDSLTPSNYHAQNNEGTCTGCGLCVKRCPMEALHLEDAPAARGRKTTIIDEQGKERQLTNKTGKISEVNINLCIGCGVCAYKCPSKSLSLHRNMADHHPPESGRDWVVQFMSQKNAGV